MRKRANGEGSVCKRPNGTWQASATIGDKRRYFYGSTQKEACAKRDSAIEQFKNGCYLAPTSTTVAEWLATWQTDYCNSLSANTKKRYADSIRLHIVPYIGSFKLQELTAPIVQRMCNQLSAKGLAPKTVGMIHGTLHAALDKAVKIELIKSNVSNYCDLPKAVKKEMNPLKDGDLRNFLNIIKGDEYESLFFVDLFTGLREGEILGLTWDCVDFTRGTVRIYRQLLKERKKGGVYRFTTTKNSKSRIIKPAPQVMEVLKKVRQQQAQWRLASGGMFDNHDNLVFTQELGQHLSAVTVYNHLKRLVAKIERPEVRFHDLRHTYATLALQNGTDVKTVSQSLGHATVAFTMDRYGHVSDMMLQMASDKMSNLINSL